MLREQGSTQAIFLICLKAVQTGAGMFCHYHPHALSGGSAGIRTRVAGRGASACASSFLALKISSVVPFN